jgi:hypothetical protein
MEQSAFGDLSPDMRAQLDREVLALALRWGRLADDGRSARSPGGVPSGLGTGPPAPAPGVAVGALARVVADLGLLAGCHGRIRGGAAPASPVGGGEAPGAPRSWAPAGLLPDDPDLYALLARVEQRLLRPLAMVPPSGGPTGAAHLPDPLSDGTGLLAAFRRVLDGVPPPGSSRPLVGPNGRWKLVGLHVLPPRPVEVSRLEAALAEMSAALAPLPLRVSQQATLRTLRHLAAHAATTPEVLVGELARVLALLDMPADRTSAELRALVSRGWPTSIRLDHRGVELYREFAHRTIPLVLEFDRLLPSLFDESARDARGSE